MSYTQLLLDSLRADSAFVATPYGESSPRSSSRRYGSSPSASTIYFPQAAEPVALSAPALSAEYLPTDINECYALLKYQHYLLQQGPTAAPASAPQRLEVTPPVDARPVQHAPALASPFVRRGVKERPGPDAEEVDALRRQLETLREEKVALSAALLESTRRSEAVKREAEAEKAELAFRLGKEAATASMAALVTGAPSGVGRWGGQDGASVATAPPSPTLEFAPPASRISRSGSATSTDDEGGAAAFLGATAIPPADAPSPYRSTASAAFSPTGGMNALLIKHEHLRQQEALLATLKSTSAANRMHAAAMARSYGSESDVGGYGGGMTPLPAPPPVGSGYSLPAGGYSYQLGVHSLHAAQASVFQHRQQAAANAAANFYARQAAQQGRDMGNPNGGAEVWNSYEPSMSGSGESGLNAAQQRYMASLAGGMRPTPAQLYGASSPYGTFSAGDPGTPSSVSSKHRQRHHGGQGGTPYAAHQQQYAQQQYTAQQQQQFGSGGEAPPGTPQAQQQQPYAGQAVAGAPKPLQDAANQAIAGALGRTAADLGVQYEEGGGLMLSGWAQLPPGANAAICSPVSSLPEGPIGYSIYQHPPAGVPWPDSLPFFAPLVEPGIPFLKHGEWAAPRLRVRCARPPPHLPTFAGRTGFPHRRLLWMDISTPADPIVCWQEGAFADPGRVKEKDRLRLIDILDIKAGRMSPILTRSGTEANAGRYMTFSADPRGLDAELGSVEMRDFVFKKFADLFSAYATAQIEKLKGDAITLRVLGIMDNGADAKPRPPDAKPTMPKPAGLPPHARGGGASGWPPASPYGR